MNVVFTMNGFTLLAFVVLGIGFGLDLAMAIIGLVHGPIFWLPLGAALASFKAAPAAMVVWVMRNQVRDEQFWSAVNASIVAVKSSPEAWADLQEEDREWEATLADGLEPEPEPEPHA